MCDREAFEEALTVFGMHGGADRVDQLGEHDRGEDPLVGDHVCAVAQDDQVFAHAQQGVEQSLTGVGAAVPVPGVGVGSDQVVAVDARDAESALVHAEDAHHTVGDPTQRRR